MWEKQKLKKIKYFRWKSISFEKSRTWSLTSTEWDDPSRNRGNSSRGIDLANCAIVRLSADGDDGHWHTWHIIWKLTLGFSIMMVMRRGTNMLGVTDCDKRMFFQSSLLYGLDDFTSIIWIVYCRSSINLKDKVVESEATLVGKKSSKNCGLRKVQSTSITFQSWQSTCLRKLKC